MGTKGKAPYTAKYTVRGFAKGGSKVTVKQNFKFKRTADKFAKELREKENIGRVSISKASQSPCSKKPQPEQCKALFANLQANGKYKAKKAR